MEAGVRVVEICDSVMAGLPYFPWNGGNCTVHNMNLLLTSSSLSDFHIESTLTKISHLHDHTGGSYLEGNDTKTGVGRVKGQRSGDFGKVKSNNTVPVVHVLSNLNLNHELTHLQWHHCREITRPRGRGQCEDIRSVQSKS